METGVFICTWCLREDLAVKARVRRTVTMRRVRLQVTKELRRRKLLSKRQ